MYKRPVHLLLLDIRDAIERIELFTKDKEKEDYEDDLFKAAKTVSDAGKDENEKDDSKGV